MKSGPPDLSSASGYEVEKKKEEGKKKESKGEVSTIMESYDVWWQNVSAQVLSGLLSFEFEWRRISFTVIS